MKCEINNDEALNMLMNRLAYWTDDKVSTALFESMYKNYIDGGGFDESNFDVMQIVDNDWINNCNVISQGNENFDEILQIYKNQGLGDCSCEKENSGANFIESVDDPENPTNFLIRY